MKQETPARQMQSQREKKGRGEDREVRVKQSQRDCEQSMAGTAQKEVTVGTKDTIFSPVNYTLFITLRQELMGLGGKPR